MSNHVMFWWGIALLLMAAETLVPGAFLLWFGFAAAAMGVVVYFFSDLPGLWQTIMFGAFSFISIAVYRKFFSRTAPIGEQPLLNRKAEQLIGRSFFLESPIVNGFGKIKIGDALWTVAGNDSPIGVKVTIVGADGMVLKVRETD